MLKTSQHYMKNKVAYGYISQTKATRTRRRRLKRLRSEPTICLRKNKNKEKEFLKIVSSRVFFCYASSQQKF